MKALFTTPIENLLTKMSGLASILGWGAYIPIYRIETAEIARVHTKGGEKPQYSVKAYRDPTRIHLQWRMKLQRTPSRGQGSIQGL